jgi:hypothetical protein
VTAVNKLAPSLKVTGDDMKVYAEGIRVYDVLGRYAEMAWN